MQENGKKSEQELLSSINVLLISFDECCNFFTCKLLQFNEEDDEYYVIYAKYIDQLDYFPIAAAAFDIFLEDDNHEKVEDYDGGDITMTLDYDYNPFEDFDSDRYFSRSQAEWEPGILHIKHDWTSEVLPATIDDDGAWTFTTSSLSLFMPAFVRVKSEEAAPVKTADNMMAYVGLVAISLAAFTTFGIYIRKTRR